ncbi:MAG: tyrosine--tRNA ligase [Minisyncoccales bacterium]
MDFKEKIKDILERGVIEIIEKKDLEKKLLSRKKLNVKFGVDPTGPDIHIGQAGHLLRLKDFQDLGHQIFFIVGDFTAQIGDTSDKNSERPMLSESEIKKNMSTYFSQVSKILDIKKTKILYNSRWLKKLGYGEIGRQADQFSLAEFINRENIKKRLKEGKRVSLRELLYPLMQAYDSVKIKANVELGGKDQRFNLLAGRTLQRYYNQEPQDILMTDLIPGPDGRKMSKSLGNTINLNDKPEEIFGKIMSIHDELTISYFFHCTRVPLKEVKEIEKSLREKKLHPKEAKKKLAFEITKICWNEKKAREAQEFFSRIFEKKETPPKMKIVKMAGKTISEILLETKWAKSKSEAKRLILQGAIEVNNRVIKDQKTRVWEKSVVKKGKRHFLKVI